MSLPTRAKGVLDFREKSQHLSSSWTQADSMSQALVRQITGQVESTSPVSVLIGVDKK